MTARALLIVALLLAASAPDAGAAAAAPKKAAPAAARAAKAKPATKPAAKPEAGSGPRTLEDIHIEGEIPVPQVLFITARDQRRFMDFHHQRYLESGREIGESTVLPTRIAVARTRTTTPRKETSP